jgi:hypothetical protein
MHLVNANPSAPVVGVEELPAKTNYFIGNVPARWHANVPNFAKVKYEGVYPGVDLVFYGNQRQLEYDFVLAPGADLTNIRLAIDNGASKLENRNSKLENQERIDAEGNLVIPTGGGEVVFHKPVVYQEQPSVVSRQLSVEVKDPHAVDSLGSPVGRHSGGDGQLTTDNGLMTAVNRQSSIENRRFLGGRYVLSADGTVRFDVAGFDRSKALIIDPALSYSTYLGGHNDDFAYGIAVDGAGSAYVVGQTLSVNFPVSTPYQSVCRGCSNTPPKTSAFVTKFSQAGTTLVYSTYLGGSFGDSAAAVAVDSAGAVYVVGKTSSNNFPFTPGAFQTSCSSCTTNGTSDAFVTKLSPDGGSLQYSTFLGGEQADNATGVAVDASGNAYVTGITLSDKFPMSANAFQSTCGGSGSSGCGGKSDAFVTVLKPDGTALVYSTFLGGSATDEGHAIAVDSSGNAYVTGQTQSGDFPYLNGYSSVFKGRQNAFVTKFDSTGALGTTGTYSTYLGGTGNDQGNGIAVDSSGEAYVTGFTNSGDFPTQNPLINKPSGSQSAFVTKLGSTGSTLVFSTYLGGSGSDSGAGIALDSAGNCYVTGFAGSSNFPVINASNIQSTFAPSQDAFMTKIDSTGTVAIVSTYLGGFGVNAGNAIAVDSSGNAYVAGQTTSNSFPTVSAYQTKYGGGNDAFVAELSGLALPSITANPTRLSFGNQAVGTTSAELTVTLTNFGDAPLNFTAPITASAPFAVTTDVTTTCSTTSPLAPSSSCTVGVTFTPTASGGITGSITFTDNEASSPQQLSLSGNGTVPLVQLTTSSGIPASTLNFGSQGIGTTSPAQIVILTNIGSAPLTINSVMVSDNFSLGQNQCGSSLAVQQSCQITVTFTPASSGTLNGSLTISDNAANSPQLVALTGNGVIAFTLSTPKQSLTVDRGTPRVTFTISAGTLYGFKASIFLTCANLVLATCSFNPSSITPGFSSTLTVDHLTSDPSSTINFLAEGTNGDQVLALPLQILIPTFGIAVSPTSETATAGQSATYVLSVVPANNFTQPITFSCLNVPTSMSCTVTPSTFSPNGVDTAALTVTVTTTARSSAGPRAGPKITTPPLAQPPWTHWLLWLMALMMLSTVAAARRRRAHLGFALSALFVLLWAACNVSSNVSNGTPPGNYGMVIQATSGNGAITQHAAFTLTVN